MIPEPVQEWVNTFAMTYSFESFYVSKRRRSGSSHEPVLAKNMKPLYTDIYFLLVCRLLQGQRCLPSYGVMFEDGFGTG